MLRRDYQRCDDFICATSYILIHELTRTHTPIKSSSHPCCWFSIGVLDTGLLLDLSVGHACLGYSFSVVFFVALDIVICNFYCVCLVVQLAVLCSTGFGWATGSTSVGQILCWLAHPPYEVQIFNIFIIFQIITHCEIKVDNCHLFLPPRNLTVFLLN